MILLKTLYWLLLVSLTKIICSAHFLPPNYSGDPEAIMDVPEIANRWGYPLETHSVITADGYILLLHRIPHGQNGSFFNSNTTRPVVFLQHGLLCTSSVWLMNMPHQSPAFILADYGYDVWMGNNRGNTYSREHINYDTSDYAYWRFSWKEMADYDLPAMIDYVLKVTGQPNLYYIGHSQGTLIMFSGLSQNRNLSHKIRKFYALAPVAKMLHVKGVFAWLGGSMFRNFKVLYFYMKSLLQLFSTMFADTEFLPNSIVSRVMTQIICGFPSRDSFCENFMFLLSGPDSNQMNKTRIGVYLAHNPAGTSTRNMMHFAQMVHSGRLAPYDYYIPLINKKHYGKPIPPLYNVSGITVPMNLYYSHADWISTDKDVEEYLLKNLPKKALKSVHRLTDFNHNDFLWGLRAPHEIFFPIADDIQADYQKLQIAHSAEPLFKKSKLRDVQSFLNASK
uniref:Abhydro_lipase domain-containing protein n=1 Tax=Syphacia muris TaxID=451379 RepID=A0A0N5ALW2_9BILA